MVDKLTLFFLSLVACQYFAIHEVSVKVALAFTTVSFYSWVIDWFHEFAIIDHQLCEAYKTSIVVCCK